MHFDALNAATQGRTNLISPTSQHTTRAKTNRHPHPFPASRTALRWPRSTEFKKTRFHPRYPRHGHQQPRERFPGTSTATHISRSTVSREAEHC